MNTVPQGIQWSTKKWIVLILVWIFLVVTIVYAGNRLNDMGFRGVSSLLNIKDV